MAKSAIFLIFSIILMLFLSCLLGYSMLFYYINADKKTHMLSIAKEHTFIMNDLDQKKDWG